MKEKHGRRKYPEQYVVRRLVIAVLAMAVLLSGCGGTSGTQMSQDEADGEAASGCEFRSDRSGVVTRHTPGALFNVLGVFASLGINVLKLESRPLVGKVFEYCFYLDFAGNLNDPDVEEAVRRLRYDCLEFIILGNYKSSPLAI